MNSAAPQIDISPQSSFHWGNKLAKVKPLFRKELLSKLKIHLRLQLWVGGHFVSLSISSVPTVGMTMCEHKSIWTVNMGDDWKWKWPSGIGNQNGHTKHSTKTIWIGWFSIAGRRWSNVASAGLPIRNFCDTGTYTFWTLNHVDL